MKLMSRSIADRRMDRLTLWDLHHGHKGFQSIASSPAFGMLPKM